MKAVIQQTVMRRIPVGAGQSIEVVADDGAIRVSIDVGGFLMTIEHAELLAQALTETIAAMRQAEAA